MIRTSVYAMQEYALDELENDKSKAVRKAVELSRKRIAKREAKASNSKNTANLQHSMKWNNLSKSIVGH